jgi:SAM-dependent methyltransferase
MPTIHNRQGVFMVGESNHNNQPDKILFPPLYHAHHKTFTSDIPFWLDLARGQGSPIIELGCGTGRVLIPLAEAGYTVYGLDIDLEMLAFCHQQLPLALTAKVNTILADLTSFYFEIRFPLVLLPCNTYSTLSARSRKSALACIYSHLSPGGLFAVSVPNPTILSQLESSKNPEIETIFTHPTNGNPVQVSYRSRRTSQKVILEWYYDQLLPNGFVERFQVSIRHRLTTKADYLQEFAQSGYAVTATYGDFDYSPLRHDSPNLVIVAKKI